MSDETETVTPPAETTPPPPTNTNPLGKLLFAGVVVGMVYAAFVARRLWRQNQQRAQNQLPCVPKPLPNGQMVSALPPAPATVTAHVVTMQETETVKPGITPPPPPPPDDTDDTPAPATVPEPPAPPAPATVPEPPAPAAPASTAPAPPDLDAPPLNDNGDVEPACWPCAEGQIKGNRDSKKYHVPGGQFYAKTYEGIDCFDTEEKAQQAGYTRSKR